MEIAEADRACDHAKELSILASDAAAEHDGIGAVVQHWPADEKAQIRIIAMYPEKLLVAAIFGDRIKRRGVDGQPSLRVEYLDHAEMLRGRRVIEQDQLPDRLAYLGDFRFEHVAHHRAQRQVVKLDVAADVRIDARGKIFERLTR